MTAEQLEELLRKVTQGEWTWERKRSSGFIRALTSAATYDDIVCAEEYAGSCWLEVENESNATLIALAPSLARRVLAAERLVEALEVMRDTTNRAGMYDYADAALSCYRAIHP